MFDRIHLWIYSKILLHNVSSLNLAYYLADIYLLSQQ